MKFAIPYLGLAAAMVVGTSPVNAATVAYWRFERGPANTPVPHGTAVGVFDGTTPDVSGNGNSLSTWTEGDWAGYAYRADVPLARVSQTGVSNQFSVKNTGANPAMFTSATGSLPSGINAQTMTPVQFTVEASYKPEANGSWRTIVGRDARDVATEDGNLAALYLQVRPDDSVGISFVDVSGYVHRAYSPPGWLYGFDFGTNPEGAGAPWYHLTGVSDGATLKMYVDNVLVASTDLTLSGSPNQALAVGTTSGADWVAGAWSVGRGLYAGGHGDRAYGFIDEVRISNSALRPGEFLFAPRPRIAGVNVSGGNLMLTVVDGQPGAPCYVLRSGNPRVPVANWPVAGRGVFNGAGEFTHTTPVGSGGGLNLFGLKADIKPPPSGAMTYSLNGAWPADARERIIYAMDGAVAQYNRYGTFNKHVIANWSPGTPTADANYEGWINFGSNPAHQNFRTALHEISHTLGVGTTWQWGANLSGGVWTGASGVAKIHEFDGPGGNLSSDGTHFWPYGLNYDSEGNTENYRRHVLMVGACRQDMGIQ